MTALSPPNRAWGLALFAAVALISGAFAADEPRDPLIPVRPRGRPELREIVPAADYDERAAPFADRIQALRESIAENAPAYGQQVTRVAAVGWATDNDLQPGDVLVRSGDKLLWGDSLPPFNSTTPLQFFLAASNRRRTLRVEAEDISAQFSSYWRPEHLYLAAKRRHSRWDDFVLLGILARGSDPDLAETAWKKATDAGYRPDVLSDQVAAEIALVQNRPGVAADFASFVNWNAESESEEIYPLLLYRVAMANFHWKRAQEIVMTGRGLFESLNPVAAVRLIEMHKSRPEPERLLPPPSQRLDKLLRSDLADRILGSNPSTIEHFQSDLRAGSPIRMTADTARYSTMAFELPEPTPNLECIIRFTGKPTESVYNRYTRWFVVRVIALTPAGEQPRDPYFDSQLTMLAITESGAVRAGCGGRYSECYMTDPTVERLEGREHEYRIVRFGGQLELFLNGHRILYGPVPDGPYPVQFEMTAVGSTIDISAIRLAEYLEPL
ncbi:MAG: hypothetical protein U0992_11085 [Planctomycetaceae bacterium]